MYIRLIKFYEREKHAMPENVRAEFECLIKRIAPESTTMQKREVVAHSSSHGTAICFVVALFFIASILAGCGGTSAAGNSGAANTIITARLLTANVGNADIFDCSDYLYKLCLTSQENILTENIAELAPDIVSVQEVFDEGLCAEMDVETHTDRMCYKYTEKQIHQQARRLLGNGYTIVCDANSHFECIGVKTTFAAVSGCSLGSICIGGAGVTHDVPDGCDTKAGLLGIDIVFSNNSTVRITNAHPQATGESCRAGELQRVFEGYDNVPALAPTDRKTIMMGDMNMDPYRDASSNADVIAWKEHVGTGKSFYYLSGIAEHNPPYKTSITGSTIDHVISNFAIGTCVTLGEAAGTTRLDGINIGTDYYQPETNDHRAILCNLRLQL